MVRLVSTACCPICIFYNPLTLHWHTVYPKKYAHGFVVLCFVVVMQPFIMNSHEVFIHIHQGCFAGTVAIVRLPQCQWSKLDGYGKISQCITTTKHSKAKTVCIFLGIYCIIPSHCTGICYTFYWFYILHAHLTPNKILNISKTMSQPYIHFTSFYLHLIIPRQITPYILKLSEVIDGITRHLQKRWLCLCRLLRESVRMKQHSSTMLNIHTDIRELLRINA